MTASKGKGPKPGSMKHRILLMKLEGMEDGEVMRALTHMMDRESIKSTIYTLRAEGRLPSLERERFFRVTGSGLLAFKDHAEKRGIMTSELASRILTTVAADPSLINAVLDDGAD